MHMHEKFGKVPIRVIGIKWASKSSFFEDRDLDEIWFYNFLQKTNWACFFETPCTKGLSFDINIKKIMYHFAR